MAKKALPTRKLLQSRSRNLQRKQTPSEIRFGARLKSHCISHQSQFVVGLYIADFWICHKPLLIELDGGIHLTRTEYDRKRDAWLRGCGYEIWRIPNAEVETFDMERIREYPRYPAGEDGAAQQKASQKRTTFLALLEQGSVVIRKKPKRKKSGKTKPPKKLVKPHKAKVLRLSKQGLPKVRQW